MSEYGQESLWRDTATADAEQARDLATRLERRAKAEDEVAARNTYLGLLDIAAGKRVLDVGCGSGAVTQGRGAANHAIAGTACQRRCHSLRAADAARHRP